MTAPDTTHAGTAQGPGIGAAWLLVDMVLMLGMTVTVKLLGGAYPAVQIVFVRCLVGLLLILPALVRQGRSALRTRQPWLQILRVTLNVGAVTANFHAVTHAPLATVSTIGFARPAVLVLLAMLVLGERPGAARWIATAVGFLGVLVVLDPRDMAVDDGLMAAVAAMILGSAAVITMRRSTEGPMALMVWYTVAMSAMTAVPAVLLWEPVRAEDAPLLLLVGTLAQLGQYCFIRAHRAADVATLAPLGYLSLVLSAAAGWLIFAEPVTGSTLAGAAIIVASTWWLRRR